MKILTVLLFLGASVFAQEPVKADEQKALSLIKELGADHLIDYTKTDYTQTGPYDMVIDVIAKRPFGEYAKAVKPGGGMAIVGGKVGTLIRAGLAGSKPSKKTGKKIGIMGQKYLLEDLDYLIDKVDRGELKPIIDKIYSLISLRNH